MTNVPTFYGVAKALTKVELYKGTKRPFLNKVRSALNWTAQFCADYGTVDVN